VKEQKYTQEDLKTMQGWSLDRKILVSQTRLMEWYSKYENKCYVSFSGGKDSTVLAYLAAQVCKIKNCRLVLWFSDTGLEFPELRTHVKTYGKWLEETFGIEVETVIEPPRDRKGNRILFRDVILREGYPIISKRISRRIHDVQKLGSCCYAARCFDGRETGLYDMRKWAYVIEAPFRVSSRCCEIMKERPAKRFSKKTGRVAVVGTMACESQTRRLEWFRNGCNAFENKEPVSKPISFWTEQDILEMLVRYKIPYASVYGDILQDEKGKWYTTGYQRTGCMFCGFGCHLEKAPNRFQRLKQTHPKVWEYCMKPVEDGGLGMRRVLEYIDVPVE